MWSGHDKDRARDHKRNSAECILFCDTDFRASDKLTAAEILEEVGHRKRAEGIESIDLIVLTGGEPALQVDKALLELLKNREGADLAIETNGTVAFKEGVQKSLDWICVSPKVGDKDIVIRNGDELKIVYPSYNPKDYTSLAKGFRHWLVQPCANTSEVGKSELSSDHREQCVQFCKKNRGWRFSMQAHKILGLP